MTTHRLFWIAFVVGIVAWLPSILSPARDSLAWFDWLSSPGMVLVAVFGRAIPWPDSVYGLFGSDGVWWSPLFIPLMNGLFCGAVAIGVWKLLRIFKR